MHQSRRVPPQSDTIAQQVGTWRPMPSSDEDIDVPEEQQRITGRFKSPPMAGDDGFVTER